MITKKYNVKYKNKTKKIFGGSSASFGGQRRTTDYVSSGPSVRPNPTVKSGVNPRPSRESQYEVNEQSQRGTAPKRGTQRPSSPAVKKALQPRSSSRDRSLSRDTLSASLPRPESSVLQSRSPSVGRGQVRTLPQKKAPPRSAAAYSIEEPEPSATSTSVTATSITAEASATSVPATSVPITSVPATSESNITRLGRESRASVENFLIASGKPQTLPSPPATLKQLSPVISSLKPLPPEVETVKVQIQQTDSEILKEISQVQTEIQTKGANNIKFSHLQEISNSFFANILNLLIKKQKMLNPNNEYFGDEAFKKNYLELYQKLLNEQKSYLEQLSELESVPNDFLSTMLFSLSPNERDIFDLLRFKIEILELENKHLLDELKINNILKNLINKYKSQLDIPSDYKVDELTLYTIPNDLISKIIELLHPLLGYRGRIFDKGLEYLDKQIINAQKYITESANDFALALEERLPTKLKTQSVPRTEKNILEQLQKLTSQTDNLLPYNPKNQLNFQSELLPILRGILDKKQNLLESIKQLIPIEAGKNLDVAFKEVLNTTTDPKTFNSEYIFTIADKLDFAEGRLLAQLDAIVTKLKDKNERFLELKSSHTESREIIDDYNQQLIAALTSKAQTHTDTSPPDKLKLLIRLHSVELEELKTELQTAHEEEKAELTREFESTSLELEQCLEESRQRESVLQKSLTTQKTEYADLEKKMSKITTTQIEKRDALFASLNVSFTNLVRLKEEIQHILEEKESKTEQEIKSIATKYLFCHSELMSLSFMLTDNSEIYGNNFPPLNEDKTQLMVSVKSEIDDTSIIDKLGEILKNIGAEQLRTLTDELKRVNEIASRLKPLETELKKLETNSAANKSKISDLSSNIRRLEEALKLKQQLFLEATTAAEAHSRVLETTLTNKSELLRLSEINFNLTLKRLEQSNAEKNSLSSQVVILQEKLRVAEQSVTQLTSTLQSTTESKAELDNAKLELSILEEQLRNLTKNKNTESLRLQQEVEEAKANFETELSKAKSEIEKEAEKEIQKVREDAKETVEKIKEELRLAQEQTGKALQNQLLAIAEKNTAKRAEKQAKRELDSVKLEEAAAKAEIVREQEQIKLTALEDLKRSLDVDKAKAQAKTKEEINSLQLIAKTAKEQSNEAVIRKTAADEKVEKLEERKNAAEAARKQAEEARKQADAKLLEVESEKEATYSAYSELQEKLRLAEKKTSNEKIDKETAERIATFALNELDKEKAKAEEADAARKEAESKVQQAEVAKVKAEANLTAAELEIKNKQAEKKEADAKAENQAAIIQSTTDELQKEKEAKVAAEAKAAQAEAEAKAAQAEKVDAEAKILELSNTIKAKETEAAEALKQLAGLEQNVADAGTSLKTKREELEKVTKEKDEAKIEAELTKEEVIKAKAAAESAAEALKINSNRNKEKLKQERDNALKKFEQAIKSNNTKTFLVEALRKKVKEVKEEKEKAKIELARAEEQIKSTISKATQSEEEKANAELEIEKIQRQIDEAQKRIGNLESELAKEKLATESAENIILKLFVDLTKAEAEEQKLVDMSQHLNEELGKSEKARTTAEVQVKEATNRIEALEKETVLLTAEKFKINEEKNEIQRTASQEVYDAQQREKASVKLVNDQALLDIRSIQQLLESSNMVIDDNMKKYEEDIAQIQVKMKSTEETLSRTETELTASQQATQIATDTHIKTQKVIQEILEEKSLFQKDITSLYRFHQEKDIKGFLLELGRLKTQSNLSQEAKDFIDENLLKLFSKK